MLGRLTATLAVALVLVTAASASRQDEQWTVAVSAPQSVAPGADFTVTATVTYTYATASDNIVLNVTLPYQATLKDFDDHTNCNASGCTFHNLSGTASVSYTMTAPSTPGTSMTSSASSFNGFSTPPTPPGASTITTTTVPPPPVSVSASSNTNQVTPGGSVSFSVTLTNTSTSDLPDASFSNELGVDWSSESMTQTSGPSFSCAHPNSFDTNCQITSFPAGATATFAATATASPTASIGEILESRFFGGGGVGGTAVGVQVIAPSSTTSTATTTPTPPTPTTPTPPTPPTVGTTSTTTTTPAETPPSASNTPPCVVPRLAGLTLTAARAALKHHHCGITVVKALSRGVPKGRIVRQTVPAGTHLLTGTPIHVVVSKGPK